MKIVLTLDVTNDPTEMGVALSDVSEALIDHAIEAAGELGLEPKNLSVFGIGVKLKGDDA